MRFFQFPQMVSCQRRLVSSLVSHDDPKSVLGKVDWFQAVLHQVSYQTVFQDLLKISLESVSIQAGSLKHEEYDIVYTCGFLKYYT